MHQGLFLTADGDRLLGRASNGFMWTWDLTRTLGWQGPLLKAPPEVSLSNICGGALSSRAETSSLLEDPGGAGLNSNQGLEPSWFARGEGIGTWLCSDDEWQLDGDVARHGCWPRPLGALPCGENWFPLTTLRQNANGARHLIAVASSTETAREDYVHLSTLL